MSATRVTATVHCTPRRAWRASTTGGHTPGLHGLLQCLLETLEAFAVCTHGTDICLQDDVLRRGGTDDLREPSEGGRAPIGPAGGAETVSAQQGCETQRGLLQIADGVFAGAGEIAQSFLFDLRDLHGGAIASLWTSIPMKSVRD
jgi:hypothetical protein